MKNKNLFFISFAIFIVTMIGMLWTEKQSGCGKDIIIPLELAPSITAFKELLVSSCRLEWIESNTYLDFVFILTYTATIFFAFRSLTDSFKLPIWLVVLPGIFDAVENVHLLKFLRADANNVSEMSFSIYYWCVYIKFGLLIVILLALLVLAIKALYTKLNGSKA